jgi:hypothetical protein
VFLGIFGRKAGKFLLKENYYYIFLKKIGFFLILIWTFKIKPYLCIRFFISLGFFWGFKTEKRWRVANAFRFL